MSVTITNVGLDLIRDGLKGANSPIITYVSLGTSTTAPAVTDTALGNEVFRKAVTSYANGASHGEILINMYLAPGDAIGTDIEEIGFWGGASASIALNSGILLARGLFSHNPKTSTESLQFQLDLTI
jgi:hypothetical protein